MRKKYGPKSLAAGIERYFASIRRTVTAVERVETGEKGSKAYVEQPILSDVGEPIRYREYVVPPTILGLCEYLGLSRETWEEYCDPLIHPEYRQAAALARDRMQDWSQRALLTRKDVRGLIYILQNWPLQSREPEEDLSLSQRRAILEELGEEE